MKNRERQRANRRRDDAPACNMIDCATNHNGTCCALQDNDFGDKVCPFYKTAEQNYKETQVALRRLESIGRCDLIEKHYLHRGINPDEC